MTDYQTDKLGMYEKVLLFLTTFAAELAGVTQIAGITTELEGNIDAITEAESIASEDTTGFTIQKKQAREALEGITLKVSQAAAAYFLSIGLPGKLKLSDYTKSELENARDNDLYVKSKKLWNLADPIKANLSAFNSGPAEVDDLNTAKEAFFDIIQLPASKRGEKTASGKDVEELMAETDELLNGLDIYMNTFSANENLYSQYKSARAIDLSGGGSSNIRQGAIAASAVENAAYNAGVIEHDTLIAFTNTGTTAGLVFYFGETATSPPTGVPVTVTLDAAESEQQQAGDAGWSGARTFLNIYNPAAGAGAWKTEIM